MGRQIQFTDEMVIEAMEEAYQEWGFASVSAVSLKMGMNRVYLSQRLKKLEIEGVIDPEQRKQWANAASRAMLERAQSAPSIKNKQLRVTVTPENYEWLKLHQNNASETINGLINIAREAT